MLVSVYARARVCVCARACECALSTETIINAQTGNKPDSRNVKHDHESNAGKPRGRMRETIAHKNKLRRINNNIIIRP